MLLKEIFNKKINENILNEMANIGKVGNLIINVYTDHLPPHFHVIKKDYFDIKIKISNLSILSYASQNNDMEISSNELKKLKKWLETPHSKEAGITNYKLIKIIWSTMNKN